MAGLPDDSGLLLSFFFFSFLFFAMQVGMIPFSQIMRLKKNEFILSSLKACHMLLCIPHSYLTLKKSH